MRLARDLQQERRHATPDEQATLAKYVGWGASDAADFLRETPRRTWSANEHAIWQDLRDLTTEAQREQLRGSATNAHFTYDLYQPIWDVLMAAGFRGGRVLEPAVGTGHAFGLMPAELRAASRLNAVELEPFTATIAQALYPSARVQATGYEQARIARGTQDLVISNVPFGKFGVTDRRMDDFLTDRIHNYFFARALEDVRPGGLVVFVSTHYTMDSGEAAKVRRITDKTDNFSPTSIRSASSEDRDHGRVPRAGTGGSARGGGGGRGRRDRAAGAVGPGGRRRRVRDAGELARAGRSTGGTCRARPTTGSRGRRAGGCLLYTSPSPRDRG
jgi:DUF971 family protein